MTHTASAGCCWRRRARAPAMSSRIEREQTRVSERGRRLAGIRADWPLITPPPLHPCALHLNTPEDVSSLGEPRGLEPRWPYNRQRERMVDRQSSNRQLRKPQKTNPRLDPDTKRPLSDRDRGGWLLPALIIGIMVAGVAIFAFGDHMPTATSPAPDTATGQSSRAPGSTPEGAPPVNR
jgi:hypothetical protein